MILNVFPKLCNIREIDASTTCLCKKIRVLKDMDRGRNNRRTTLLYINYFFQLGDDKSIRRQS